MGPHEFIDKLVVRLKVVPDAQPNAKGVWITCDVHPRYLYPKTDWGYLNSRVKADHHVVAVSSHIAKGKDDEQKDP